MVRTRLKNLLNGAVLEKSFKTSEKFPEPDVQLVSVSFLYSDPDGFHCTGNAVSLQLPQYVELTIASTEPGVRGDTRRGKESSQTRNRPRSSGAAVHERRRDRSRQHTDCGSRRPRVRDRLIQSTVLFLCYVPCRADEIKSDGGPRSIAHSNGTDARPVISRISE